MGSTVDLFGAISEMKSIEILYYLYCWAIALRAWS